ncbi:MAG: hypothetical protein WAT51_07890 [Holophaga sp.]
MSVRVLVVDDEAPARAKARRLLASDARLVGVGEAKDDQETLNLVESLWPAPR